MSETERQIGDAICCTQQAATLRFLSNVNSRRRTSRPSSKSRPQWKFSVKTQCSQLRRRYYLVGIVWQNRDYRIPCRFDSPTPLEQASKFDTMVGAAFILSWSTTDLASIWILDVKGY
jgi:hypothetical protein